MTGQVACDEVSIVAGHTGYPDQVRQQSRTGRRRRLKGARGRGTLAKEKPPIFGMIERGGQVVIRMVENVKHVTIRPLIEATIEPGTCVYTNEYDIYSRLESWGYARQSVNHSQGEYVRDDDGDGFHEVQATRSKAFGHCSGAGYGLTGGSPKSSCLCI